MQNMYIPKNVKTIIEPFAGNCDMLKFVKDEEKKLYKIKLFDIDPKKDFVEKRDTLKNPPLLKEAFIITNPPYIARNKAQDKSIFDKYKTNDLYKCFIKNLTLDMCLGDYNYSFKFLVFNKGSRCKS